ncbi:MAG: LegC family aminotransferase [Acidobacteriota bacterium]
MTIGASSSRGSRDYDLDSVLDTIASVAGEVARERGEEPQPMGLQDPRFDGNERRYVLECLETTYVSSSGPFVTRFEEALAEATGAKKVLATVNGTAALHLGLKLLGVQPGDEVLVPTLTFVATANAVTYCGAIPHFIDSESLTLGADPGRLRRYLEAIGRMEGGVCVNRQTGRAIRALMPMHTFGHPVDMAPLLAVASDFRLEILEDAANGLGTLYHGRHVGTFGRAAVLSFNGNKIITTGGGGALLTMDPELAQRARHLATTAKRPHRWAYWHDEVAHNYRMPNLNAALGLAQVEQLPDLLTRKRELAQRYLDAFESVPGVSVFSEPAFARSNYWLSVLLLDRADEGARDALLEGAYDRGLGARPAWELLHRLPMYRQCPRMDLSTAEDLHARLINLPSGSGLGRPAALEPVSAEVPCLRRRSNELGPRGSADRGSADRGASDRRAPDGRHPSVAEGSR